MKFAFSTAGIQGQFEQIAATAKRLFYDGLEVDLPATGSSPEARSFQTADVAIACLADIRPIGGRHDIYDETRSKHICGLIEFAKDIGCPLVRITESPIRPRQNRAASGAALGDWLLPLADYAADRGVTLALDNTLSLRTAKEIWTILDRLNHPSLGCSLDLFTAARIGQTPQVVVPMLNSRIVYVQVSDARDLSDAATDCDLGDGVVPIETTIARLRGIGYSGWITVRLPGALETVEPGSSRAIAVLRQWSQPVEQKEAKVKASR